MLQNYGYKICTWQAFGNALPLWESRKTPKFGCLGLKVLLKCQNAYTNLSVKHCMWCHRCRASKLDVLTMSTPYTCYCWTGGNDTTHRSLQILADLWHRCQWEPNEGRASPPEKVRIRRLYCVFLLPVNCAWLGGWVTIEFWARNQQVAASDWGYWRRRAHERLGDPPPTKRWIQQPLVVRDRDGRPPIGPSGSALLLCV